jgi:hypothetical protein
MALLHMRVVTPAGLSAEVLPIRQGTTALLAGSSGLRRRAPSVGPGGGGLRGRRGLPRRGPAPPEFIVGQRPQ